MLNVTKSICLCAVIILAINSPVLAQPAQAQTFTLQKGQAIRITPEGKVDVFEKLEGDPAHIAKMHKRAKPITKGLAIWVGDDGKLRYLTNPVEGAPHISR